MQGICPKPLTENWMVISAVSHPLLRSCGCGDVPGLRRSSCGMWMTPMTRMTRMKNGWKMSLKRVVMDEKWHCFTFGSYSAGILSRNVADEVAGSRTRHGMSQISKMGCNRGPRPEMFQVFPVRALLRLGQGTLRLATVRICPTIDLGWGYVSTLLHETLLCSEISPIFTKVSPWVVHMPNSLQYNDTDTNDTVQCVTTITFHQGVQVRAAAA